MKVMMLGHSNSGKTTYMAAMYSIMNEVGAYDFSMRAISDSKHKALEGLGAKIKRGFYPDGTDIHQEYRFNLSYAGKKVLPFNWHDYRGGALRESINSSSETASLYEEIKYSDALIIFIDSEDIVNNTAKSTSNIRRLISLMQQAVANTSSEAAFPVSIVVTKSDQYESSLVMESDGFKPILAFCEAISESENIGGILVFTQISRDAIYNVQFPLLFSMLSALINKKIQMESKLDVLMDVYKSYYRQANIIDDFFSWITSTDSYTDLARRKYRQAAKEYEKYEEVFDSLSVLAKALEEARHEGYFFSF